MRSFLSANNMVEVRLYEQKGKKQSLFSRKLSYINFPKNQISPEFHVHGDSTLQGDASPSSPAQWRMSDIWTYGMEFDLVVDWLRKADIPEGSGH